MEVMVNATGQQLGAGMRDKPMSPFNDERLSQLQEMARELKELNRELNEMIFGKCDALLGSMPTNPMDTSMKEGPPAGWVEETMQKIRRGINACRSSLERMSVV